jgi:hypothetical protein
LFPTYHIAAVGKSEKEERKGLGPLLPFCRRVAMEEFGFFAELRVTEMDRLLKIAL